MSQSLFFYWISEKKRIGFLVVTYKNDIQVIWLYKRVKGTRVAINLPNSFTYNPEAYKVAATLTKTNKDNKFAFVEEIVMEYIPDEMLSSLILLVMKNRILLIEFGNNISNYDKGGIAIR